MFQILFLLTYYEIDIYTDYTTLQLIKLYKYKYGFKQNAKFSLTFSGLFHSKILFGLASDLELNRIDAIYNFSIFCNGLSKLTQIQYLITSDTKVNGTVLNQRELIPYFYTCTQTSEFQIGFEYFNGNNHLDYRLQNITKFNLFYMIFTSIYIIIFIIINCRKTTKDSFNNLLIGLLLTFLIQDVTSFLYFHLQSDHEYIRGRYENFSDFSDYFLLLSFFAIFLSFLFIFAYSFMRYMHENNPKPNCCRFTILIIPIFCISFFIPLMWLNFGALFSIIAAVLVIIFGLFVVFLPPRNSIVKFAFAIYIIGTLCVSPVAHSVMFFIVENVSVNYVVFVMMIAFPVFQSLAMIFLLGSFCEKKVENVDNQPIIHNESSFTCSSMPNENSEPNPYAYLTGNQPQSQGSSPYLNIY